MKDFFDKVDYVLKFANERIFEKRIIVYFIFLLIFILFFFILNKILKNKRKKY